ncbi:ABC transporter ATP-binding protein/permease [Microbacterium aurugineum]|uniref:ABC transporter ATP-binding protein/permease n=1 Tax=Microbacterium aurugineum TaxID=2851642 RepID=UPI0020BD9E69|nr:ABC transporter ATP-binding protein/permease [Microbacterium aurugineum]MCK8475644.1 ABC transporter ATP-binding protein/permease [Microbacterium aurugineum]
MSATRSESADVPLIRLRGVRRTYSSEGRPDVDALRGIDLDIAPGEFVAVVGPSGGGKTTLMNILGLLDDATAGSYALDGEKIRAGDGRRAASVRARKIGFVFQAFHLLEARPAVDSVELNLLYRGMRRSERKVRVRRAIESVGLRERASQNTSTLSGGQRQRIAIARAIAADAKLILADEPTGNLDSGNSARILEELERLNQEGATVVVVTHSPDVAARARRVIHIADGKLVADLQQSTPAALAAPSSQENDVHPSQPEREPQRANGVAVPQDVSAPSEGRIRFADMLRDAWASVVSRRTQSLGQGLAIAIAVGLAITTLGLSASASTQVSATFDAHLNREISAHWSTAVKNSPPLETVPHRVAELSGVDAAAVVVDLGVSTIATFAEARQVQPHVVIGEFSAAARLSIEEAPWHHGELKAGEAYVGDLLANDLQLSSIDGAPTVLIDGASYVVAGVIAKSPRLPLLRGEVVVGPRDDLTTAGPIDVTMLAVTTAGAAQQVARQVPAVINPFQPEQITVDAPTDSAQLRGQIEQGVQTTLTAFTLLALIVATAALMNATLLAVNARRGEIGMRKALGARDRQIGTLITIESAYIGIVGGLAGLVLGMGAILTVTVSQRWAPVFDIVLLPAAIAIGLLVGAGGGGLASIRAARLRPAENLRG